MPTPAQLRCEQSLANAHRALWYAHKWAESMSDQGLADDIYQITLEVFRVQESLLKSARRRQVRLD